MLRAGANATKRKKLKSILIKKYKSNNKSKKDVCNDDQGNVVVGFDRGPEDLYARSSRSIGRRILFLERRRARKVG